MFGSDSTGTDRDETESRRLAEEQAALRRVATLVARQTSQEEVFTAVAQELGRVIGVEAIRTIRFDEVDGMAAAEVVAASGGPAEIMPAGLSVPLGGNNLTTEIFESGTSVRRDDYSVASGPIAELARQSGVSSAVGAPVYVDGRLWGAMIASTMDSELLPPDIEVRLGQFTELMGTAIANAAARAEARTLADEQAALRRVATLVAERAPAAELFAKVADEVAKLFGEGIDSVILRYEDTGDANVLAIHGAQPWGGITVGMRIPVDGGSVTARVRREQAPVRVDDYGAAEGTIAERARRHGIRSAIGSPIIVHGRLWGVMAVSNFGELPFPVGSEIRISRFTELIAAAIANIEATAEVQRLADEQAALRRVAMVPAGGAPSSEIFESVITEVKALLGCSTVGLLRFEPSDEARLLAHIADQAEVLRLGTCLPLDGESAVATVFRTGRAARRDQPSEGTGAIAEFARRNKAGASIAAPITIEGETWGAIATSWERDESPPPAAVERLAQFAQLLDTALANTQARDDLQRLAEEQAALRRVATLVAEGATSSAVFDAVIFEARELLGGAQAGLMRYENDREAAILARETDDPSVTPPGTLLPLEGDSVIVRVYRTGRPARINHVTEGQGRGSEIVRRNKTAVAIGAPITVERRTWGALVVSWEPGHEPPQHAEDRLAKFAQLLDTALSNTEARAEVHRLADEQAALRRVATLVAGGASPDDVFAAVVAEAGKLLDAQQFALARYEGSDEVTVLAIRADAGTSVRAGMRLPIDGDSLTFRVLTTERPARIDLPTEGTGTTAEIGRRGGMDISIGAPVWVEGHLWGILSASWNREMRPAKDTERRLAEFAQLLDTAIANADSRDQLTASRARVLSAGDDARRRVVRDLHDGAQQRLVHAIVTLRMAKRSLETGEEGAVDLLDEGLDQVERGNSELRELSRGILPSILIRGGLRAAIGALVSRLRLRVEVEVTAERLPAEIEASAYFVVAEALTNVVKHANANWAEVEVTLAPAALRLRVTDDGVGGADPHGHGLIGLADRVAALGGRLEIDSPPGAGTALRVELPLPG